MKAEERKHIKKLDLIDEKLARGEELTPKDLELIKEAEGKLKELAEKKQDVSAPKPSSREKQSNSPSPPAPAPNKAVTNQNAEVQSMPQKIQQNLIKKPAVPPPPPKIELVYLGEDFKKISFDENAYTARSRHFTIKLLSAQILENGNLKLDLLHTAYRGQKGVLTWIEKPEAAIYVTDEKGIRYNFIEVKGLEDRYDQKEGVRFLGGKVLPIDVPIGYSFTFSKIPEKTKEINLVSTYNCATIFFPSDRADRGPVCFHSDQENAVIKNIKLFK